jgi:SAM-dependent methyltransferase
LELREQKTKIRRQTNRYRPHTGQPYFELNQAISVKLDGIRDTLDGKKILDVGAGEVPFKSFYNNLQVDTCDIHQNISGTIDFVIEDNGNLPFANESYDVLFVFDVLEHVKHDSHFIKECHRILRPNGKIILTIPFMYRFHEQPYDYRRYTPSGINYLISEVGFLQIKEMSPLGSVLFVIQTVLGEKSFKPKGWRRLLYMILYRCVKYLSLDTEVSDNCPFGYYVFAQKLNFSKTG